MLPTPEKLEEILRRAISASANSRVEYGVRVTPDGSVFYEKWTWYLRNQSVIEDADYMIHVAGYLPRVEKGCHDDISELLGGCIMLAQPRGILKRSPTIKEKQELWWQKEERLAREKREQIAALHRDIRGITGI